MAEALLVSLGQVESLAPTLPQVQLQPVCFQLEPAEVPVGAVSLQGPQVRQPVVSV